MSRRKFRSSFLVRRLQLLQCKGVGLNLRARTLLVRLVLGLTTIALLGCHLTSRRHHGGIEANPSLEAADDTPSLFVYRVEEVPNSSMYYMYPVQTNGVHYIGMSDFYSGLDGISSTFLVPMSERMALYRRLLEFADISRLSIYLTADELEQRFGDEIDIPSVPSSLLDDEHFMALNDHPNIVLHN